ncbi:MAG: 4-amino-4-deoxy-L-arabinose transferase [Nocardioides sp.]|uniref:uridine kinase family protein n=1 Tax=Nocardioides sp. TaxID=35761 RepID=UPI0039E38C27
MASPSDPLPERTQVLAIDGPAGSGKTTLASTLRLLQPCVVIHMDDLYDGWDGLDAGIAQVEAILAALAAGEPAGYRRYDWAAGAYAATVAIPATPLLVIEGVGAGGTERAPDCLVWMDAPAGVRRERALARGDFGAPADQRWEHWAALEAAHFARARTRERADLVVEP